MTKLFIAIIIVLACATGWFARLDYQMSHGDFNHDGQVNLKDVSVFLSRYQKAVEK
jgi:hypothetical protein